MIANAINTFAADRFCTFARDAIVASAVAKTATVGLSHEVWQQTRFERSLLAVDGMRETFASWLAVQPAPVRSKCAKWRTSSPLAARISECAKVVRFAIEQPERASELWTSETLAAALKIVRSDAKAKADAEAAARPAPAVSEEVSRIIAELALALAILPLEERAAAVVAAAAMLDAALSV